MFDVPRCREWTPLATQQLRLRSLIQIVGYNIRPPERSSCSHSYYYTLHATTMSAPFYTSEKIASPHPKWREIHADLTQRMSSTNVVIRIWCRLQTKDKDTGDNFSDVIIQTWGVYFSGLRLIGANLALDFTSDSFKANTLVFQMHGGYFCSYRSLNLEVIPSENLYEFNSVSSGSSRKPTDATARIPIEANYLQNHRIIKESRSISPTKRSYRNDLEYSKSQSPTERGFRQSFANIKPSASLNIAPNKRDIQMSETDQIYEHSPDNLDVKVFTMSDLNCDISKHPSKEELYRSHIDLSETAENYDLRTETNGIPKCRYLCLNFLKSEVRPSYKLEKLQSLHLLQYVIKKRKDAVQEIKERIYKKSALENSTQAASGKDSLRVRRPRRNLFASEGEGELDSDRSAWDGGKMGHELPATNGPRPNLKLNDLLSYKSRPTPQQRSDHARLTRQLEVLRFKRRLLADERDSKLASIRRLKDAHARLFEESQDTGTELMQGYHTLSRRAEQLRRARQSTAALRELAARAAGALAQRQNALLARLRDVFVIEYSEDVWRICALPLPVCGDEPAARRAAPGAHVAASLAAQCCRAAAALLARPLRYRLLLLSPGAAVEDHLTPNLPDPLIPLYARGGDSSLFRYGMFLLNKCCAQLLWGCGRPVADIRPTLANLQRLMLAGDCLTASRHLFTAHGAPSGPCAHSQSLRSLVASERGQNRPFNRFKDCVDAHSPASAKGLWRHRHSRSVGSYRDDHEIGQLDMSTTSIMGSEPFLHDTKMASSDDQLSKRSSLLKCHNSDSELSRISLDKAPSRADGKVVFTLGDTATDSPLTVKLSTNDEECQECMDETVKKICSEITDFWPRAEGSEYVRGDVEGSENVKVDAKRSECVRRDHTMEDVEGRDYFRGNIQRGKCIGEGELEGSENDKRDVERNECARRDHIREDVEGSEYVKGDFEGSEHVKGGVDGVEYIKDVESSGYNRGDVEGSDYFRGNIQRDECIREGEVEGSEHFRGDVEGSGEGETTSSKVIVDDVIVISSPEAIFDKGQKGYCGGESGV